MARCVVKGAEPAPLLQVLRASSLGKVKPFLDPANDTITSTQLTRHRLLALSCMCPGAEGRQGGATRSKPIRSE